MTDPIKVQRATVTIGSIEVDGFQLPDGSYRMSVTQAAETIGLGVQNASDFSRSKAIKPLLGEGYTPQTCQLPISERENANHFRATPVISCYLRALSCNSV
ncbi:hypothetical protein IQ249_25030 [Lusitaniella coriacea LEGE 07157]|uniref:Uncharacterized protein n=1 Tax=Lusitaniella coriacea LEGE 07157 TaxID=945747 RepID=A0A8J7E0G0_9CYAN|nr:hypothetical protein [Lusitaniella coriacea]MBE9119124.1 hypothetical protein [Lusitaniella coriacea LEGE 07157]